MVTCFAPGCNHSSLKDSCSFYWFPKDVVLRRDSSSKAAAPFVPSHSSTFNSLVPALPKAQKELQKVVQEKEQLMGDLNAMKVHVEEKISLANDEIEHVRSKQKAETSTLQAQLRREQLKVCSLEKSLEQKAKETEELTKLCDDLIANIQRR